MRELVVCVELPVRPAGSMCWEFFDWSALDSSLAVLAKNRPALRVTFDLSLTLLGGAASPDTFGPLASQLRKSLLMGLKIKVVARHGPSKRRHSDDTVKTCWLSVTPRSLE
ncbi:uncharacterized protein B0H18DRAFT_1214653 [Fomitopsis serialis]|uniref:uncharacterized protein n=1 Tax=Fomitopsis serialis TaxID=139415 RepID=UPI0020077686|nr:uncharacterized protein B0H18DRAFT_1214653 [Neoantrodia serialis]KAH9917309.1 hypothetical protein B0H18DRAFT_1214653 [Neoantrodia serialis]